MRKCLSINLFIIFVTPFLLGTSCIKEGPYVSVIQEIECLPAEYHFPLYKEKGRYKLELTDMWPTFCEGVPMYQFKVPKEHITLYAKIKRNGESCFLHLATGTYEQLNTPPSATQERFKRRKEGLFMLATLFPEVIGMKTIGKSKIKYGKMNSDGIRDWCKNI